MSTTSDRGGSTTCEPRSYDLTEPPSRDDLGMRPGRSYVDVSCDDGFELALTLPEKTATTLTARRLNADSYNAANTETGAPTTIDVHSVGLDLDAAITLTRQVASDLGIDVATALPRFRRDVDAAADANVDSPFVRATLGYLTAELQVQHLGTSGTNYVHLILSWS